MAESRRYGLYRKIVSLYASRFRGLRGLRGFR
jgi:hypothetical protein